MVWNSHFCTISVIRRYNLNLYPPKHIKLINNEPAGDKATPLSPSLELPLLKILGIRAPLSIQLHPDSGIAPFLNKQFSSMYCFLIFFFLSPHLNNIDNIATRIRVLNLRWLCLSHPSL